MDRLKTLLLIISLVFSVGLTSAQDADIGSMDDYTIEYDTGGNTISVTCDGSDCPSAEIQIRICDDRALLYHQSGNLYETTDITIPRDNKLGSATELQCTVGDQGGFEVWNTNTFSSNTKLADNVGNLEVDYSHAGVSGGLLALTVEQQVGRSDDLDTWQIYTGNAFDGDHGEIRIKEPDSGPDDLQYRDAKTGFILSQENTGSGYLDNVNDMLENPLSNTVGYNTYEVATKTFDNNLDAHCGGNCPIGRIANSENPDFQLRGEIIMGERFYSTDENWPSGSVTGSNQQFHICDSEVDGQYYMDGKNVYSPGNNFNSDYFECRDNQWIQREQCPPGYEWANRDEGWKCYEKEPVTIDVNLLNVTNVGYQDFYSGYTAGIKIPSDEATKFETLYDAELQEVTAECWMGKEDERPSDPSLKMQVTADIDGFRFTNPRVSNSLSNIWVLGNIPYRDADTGASNNKTYSCVWGMNGEGQYGKDIYQGVNGNDVNGFKLNSRDDGSIEMDVSAVRDMQNLYSDHLHNSVNWGSYSNDDRSGISGDSVNPFISPNREYPYCPPINDDAKIICT